MFVYEFPFDLRCFLLTMFFIFPNGFADKNVVVPNFSLVNQPSLDKILKAEVFIHSDGQLRAAHLILSYTPISKSFQVPKCVIKAKDPHLHRISVVVPSFLSAGPILKGIPKIALPSQCAVKEEATPSQPSTKEEEGIVKVSDSEDDFEIFNQPLSPPSGDLGHPPPTQASQALGNSPLLEDMGIQHKPKAGLLAVMKSQAGDKVPEKATQAKIPPSLPTQPLRANLADHKRERD